MSSPPKKERILVISALFPPNVLGGAEMTAAQMASQLAQDGYEVGVLTAAGDDEDVIDGAIVDGIWLWRLRLLRPYSVNDFQNAPAWKKPLWHILDHFDPSARPRVRKIIAEFKPDWCNVHIVQGLGYPILLDIAAAGIPTVFVLHDLGLACIRMSMFKNGQDCAAQCKICRLSSLWKSRLISKFDRIGFCSPSLANMDRLAGYFPVKSYKHAAILNANAYPQPTVERVETTKVRLLFVGRLHATKGVGLLLEAASRLATHYKFTLTIIGSGPEEQMLKEEYGTADWCRFTGFVTQSDISNHIVNSDVMCVPSIWAENSPGVVVHALSLGLPVIGSNRGGIPELIDNGATGALVEPGDVSAWAAQLRNILESPKILKDWRAEALRRRAMFDPKALLQKHIAFMRDVSQVASVAIDRE